VSVYTDQQFDMNKQNDNSNITNAEIDAIIFDVGWVLVHLDFKPLLGCLTTQDGAFNMQEVIAAIDLEAHERGEISSAELIDRLHGLTQGVQREQVKRGWLDMFTPIVPMFELVKQLRSRYRVYLLSNVGELHWAHLNQLYNLRDLVQDALPSFQAGVMKPHADIYRMAERRFGLAPQHSVFIDDLEPNIQAARARGWHGVHHVSPQQTLHDLRSLGVEC
jgi:epoxide hydrolase-like predicted phosphatase